MKVRIEYTVEVTDEERLALAAWQDLDGKAPREAIREFFAFHGTANARSKLKQRIKKYYEELATEYAEKAKQLKDE